ncbi:ABC-2 type transport system permease protein [Keratinibaculum paraultunense]|uniref:ABC-2 type transport system permease protein n=1 Tax=Keratinibaculum paraultunense TaxID=1278232 RepID=A0A4R3KT76_9FIRM|nr:ABC transporter permease [Keratinibaculum paraultunense]NLV76762.1 ABC transporter permease [Tissierellia bacterium]QQY78846.1 ABC transporter permease [Keratinibaculum paraultunense]TCS87443.1 ABC-2 type transport system permease protein [Keratinibaculum paraultunense]
MTVYKYFIKIALKNKWTILGYTIIFFSMSLISGSGATEREPKFMETRLNIGIIDNSNSELSTGLKDYLEGKHNMVDTIDDEDYIKEQIFLERADAIIIIPEDFQEKVINKEKSIKIYNDDRKIESMQIQNQINKFLMFANATYEDGKFNLANVNLALREKAKVKLANNNREKNNSINNEWFRNYYNFTSYVIIAMYIAIIGMVMTDFTDENIDSRMKISSKKFLNFNMELYLGQLTIAAIITSIFILGSIVLKGKYIGEVDFIKYVINIIVFSFTILCFTFFINNFTKNKFVISGLATVLSLATSFISGVMVPQEFLGEKTLLLAKFFPTYYFVKVNGTTVNSFSDISFNIFMQLSFAVAFILMGLYFSKAKQKA